MSGTFHLNTTGKSFVGLIGPWRLARGLNADGTDPAVANSAEDNQNARAAKTVCLNPLSKRCPALLQPLQKEPRPSPLVSLAVVEAGATLLCEPGSRTTEQPIFEKVMELAATMGRPLFGLFSHQAGLSL